MSQFNLLAATRTIEKSMSFVLYRFAMCFGTGLGFLFATLAGAGTFVGFGSLAKNASTFGPFGAVLGFAAFGYLLYKLRPTWLHAIRAPLLALLADQAKGQPLPAGKALIDHAKRRVAENFPSTSGLFQQDSHVRAGLMALVESNVPAAGDSPLAKYRVLGLGHLFARNHQTILAWHFFYDGNDFPRTTETALAAHKRHYGTLLKYRLYATLFELIGFAAAYPLLLIGIQTMVSGIPINMSFWPYLFAGVFAWALQAAFFEPIAEAAMLETFLPLALQNAPAETETTASNQTETDSGQANS